MEIVILRGKPNDYHGSESPLHSRTAPYQWVFYMSLWIYKRSRGLRDKYLAEQTTEGPFMNRWEIMNVPAFRRRTITITPVPPNPFFSLAPILSSLTTREVRWSKGFPLYLSHCKLPTRKHIAHRAVTPPAMEEDVENPAVGAVTLDFVPTDPLARAGYGLYESIRVHVQNAEVTVIFLPKGTEINGTQSITGKGIMVD